jgi:hypothetical protein
VRHRGRSPSFQAGRGLIQQRRPIPQRGRNPSGGLFLEVCDRHKRLDPKIHAVARPMLRVGDIAGFECQIHASDKPAAHGRVDGLLDILGLSVGLDVLLLAETIRSHSSLPPDASFVALS